MQDANENYNLRYIKSGKKKKVLNRTLMRDSLSQRKHTFSKFWLKIFQTRFVLCLIIVVSSFFIQEISRSYIIAGTIIYISINLAFGFFKQNVLRQKRVRVIPAIIDIIFASFLIYLTGGQNSPWVLLYIFPIVSVSRYLSYEGSVPLALSSVFIYVIVIIISTQNVEMYPLILKSLMLLGIGFVIGNLTRTKHYEKDKLIDVFKEIDEAIINNAETDEVLKLIVENAVKITTSDIGKLKILNDEGEIENTVSISGTASVVEDLEFRRIGEKYYKKAFTSKKSVSLRLTKIKKNSNNGQGSDQQFLKDSNRIFIDFIEKSENISGFAIFVPLVINQSVKAVIALYTRDVFHYYLKNEAIILGNFAPLLGIALKNSKLYQEILDSENEKKERLKMLFEIGEQLKVEQGLPMIFRKVVELTYNRLNSEEAALFIWDEKETHIKKEAVQGPSEEVTAKLEKIEKPYKKGNSLIGRIFGERTAVYQNSVEENVQYKEDYAKTLPSESVRHYIGVPLIIGEEVLGVIRVINKRAVDYSLKNDNFALSEEGFDEEDFELMQTLASQVASAIRSARFIEVQRYYQELIENSPDPIIVLDEKGKIKVFNEACEKIWGFEETEVIGKSVEDYYDSKEHAVQIGKELWVSPNKRIQDFPAKIRNFRNEIIPISLSASLLFDKQGNQIGSIGVFKDLRETQKLQEEKTTAEKLVSLGKLAHTVGHEIKHDIATALNYIDTLAYESDDEELLEIYQYVQESLGEAVDKFQNMLMVGKPKPPQKKYADIYEIFSNLEIRMNQRANSENIELSIDYPDDDVGIMADVEQIKQALMNLFNNSVDAIKINRQKASMVEKGRIELLASSVSGSLQINCKDNGCGISPQNISKVFMPFITDKDTGNGLGLFIVKSIIENHNGRITVESEEGTGTSFNIILPILSEDDFQE